MSGPIDVEFRKKNFTGNIIISMLGLYFSVKQPDVGLSIDPQYNGVIGSLILNPTSVDLKTVNTTITSYSFKLLDIGEAVTKLCSGNVTFFTNVSVDIYIGRSTGSFSFADYYKLPTTIVKKVDYADGVYSFSSVDQTDRISRPVFNKKAKLAGDILAGTTIFIMQGDLTDFPTAGTMKVDNELIGWTGVDLVTNQLTGGLRGLSGSVAVNHNAGVDCLVVVPITDHPLNILMKILISGGGGGIYDTLSEGLGISQSLIDIAGIETLRDGIFSGQQFKLDLYNITDALSYLEQEILLACNLRFAVSEDSKITLVLLDQSIFGSYAGTITEDTITASPKLAVDQNQIINNIEIQWDFDEATGQYLNRTPYEDASSIALYGRTKIMSLAFKGIRASLSGQAIVNDRATRILRRFSTPTPVITLNTHMDKIQIRGGQKALVSTSKLPSPSGTLGFSNELEVLSSAINYQNGDISFKLAFTSYTGLRLGYIAPSDLIVSFVDQRTFNVRVGRGVQYSTEWVLRLWDDSAKAYYSDPANSIESIVGDQITMVNPFTSPLVVNVSRIRFGFYDEVTLEQKRYAFISQHGGGFADGTSAYVLSF